MSSTARVDVSAPGVDRPAGLAARIIIDLRDLTAVDDRGLGLLNAAVGDGRARETSLTLLLCGGAAQAAIADVFISAGLPVELTSATAPATPHSRRRARNAPHMIWGERLFGENGDVSRWRSRVAHHQCLARPCTLSVRPEAARGRRG